MYVSIDAARQQMAVHGDELWRGALELADWAGGRSASCPACAAWPPRSWRSTACRVRRHAADHLRLRPRPQRLPAGDRAARRLPHRRRGRRPAQRRAQRHLRRRREDIEHLVGALRDLAAGTGARPAPGAALLGLLARPPPFTRQVLTPRDAFFAPAVARPSRMRGEVSAEMVTPYPPGIPVLGPGRRSPQEIVDYLRVLKARALELHRARARGPEPAHAARRRLTPRARPGARVKASLPRPTSRPEESSLHAEDSRRASRPEEAARASTLGWSLSLRRG